MKKSILGLKGAHELTRDEQRSIQGKGIRCTTITVSGTGNTCPPGTCCTGGRCYPDNSVQCCPTCSDQKN